MKPDAIFVFGSNYAGYHGAGAAKYALDHKGAVYGEGIGLYGQSYALPTKPHSVRERLSIETIDAHVWYFKRFAKEHPELDFQVTRIGCGLAGYKDAEIAPLFINSPQNCYFDLAWQPYLHTTASYWGRG